MSFNDVPVEILQHIFENLCGSDVYQCRKVCQKWNIAVEGLGGSFWNGLCAKEHFEIYEPAYRKTSLSWRQLYTSLNLWSDIAAADVKIHRIPDEKVNKFQILPNGVIACPFMSIFVEDGLISYDTIIYYDLETLEERRRETFDFTFMRFEENDSFIIMTVRGARNSSQVYVNVVLKANMKSVVFGKNVCTSTWSWLLFKNELYLQCSCFQFKHLYRMRVVKKNNDTTLEIDDFKYREDHLIVKGVAKINNEQTNVLATDGRIYSLIGKELKLIFRVDVHDKRFKYLLRKHGFTWRRLRIFNFCTLYLRQYTKVAYNYGKVVIVHDSENYPPTIDVYDVLQNNPYNCYGELQDGATPTKSIDLTEVSASVDLEIHQIGVVETVNGHKIVLSSLTAGTFVIELSHKTEEDMAPKAANLDFYNVVYTRLLKARLRPRIPY